MRSAAWLGAAGLLLVIPALANAQPGAEEARRVLGSDASIAARWRGPAGPIQRVSVWSSDADAIVLVDYHAGGQAYRSHARLRLSGLERPMVQIKPQLFGPGLIHVVVRGSAPRTNADRGSRDRRSRRRSRPSRVGEVHEFLFSVSAQGVRQALHATTRSEGIRGGHFEWNADDQTLTLSIVRRLPPRYARCPAMEPEHTVYQWTNQSFRLVRRDERRRPCQQPAESGGVGRPAGATTWYPQGTFPLREV
ncbi:MAG: hypothetical protein AAGE52_42340 [Myxococcota bacterium]